MEEPGAHVHHSVVLFNEGEGLCQHSQMSVSMETIQRMAASCNIKIHTLSNELNLTAFNVVHVKMNIYSRGVKHFK